MGFGDLAQTQAAFPAIQYPLTVNPQRRAPDLPSFHPRPPHTRLDSFDYGLPLDLRDCAHDDDHRPTERASGVDVLSQADKLDAEMIQFVEHFQEVADVSRYPVERGHEHNVKAAASRVRQKLVKSGPLRFRAANGVGVLADDLESPLRCQLPQVENLVFEMLVGRRNSGINRGSFHRLGSP
jgi:hypothetical protein